MGLFRRILALGNRSALRRDNAEELSEHMQMRIDANMARGMSAEEARREARRRFGNPVVVRERVDAEDAALGLGSLYRDARYAVRGFVKSPGFTFVVILTLALGIGANTAIFELLDAVRLRTLPVQDPQELAELRIAGGNPGGFGVIDGPYSQFTIPMWLEVRRNHEPFSGIFAWRSTDVLEGRMTDAKRIHGLEVSGEFFNILGVGPWQGRLIEPQDEGVCGISKVVVSYPYWKSHLGGQPITAATTTVMDGHAAQVLGVTPPSFFGLVVGDQFDVAFPACTPSNPPREAFVISVMGRLKPGWTLDRATQYFRSLSPGIFDATVPAGYSAQGVATYKAFRLAAYPAGAGVSKLRADYDASLRLLLAITGLVLLIACANLANLMLARASVRQREMAIRLAVGASRGRLLRQLLIEGGLLAFAGAGLGVALAQPLSRLLVASLNTSHSAIQLAIAPDWRVLLFAAGVAGMTAIVFGTVPALRGAKADPITALKSGARGMTGSRERFSMQRFMVITQISVSMVLLVGALLFVRSYRNLATLDPGMRENGITVGYFGFYMLGVKPENEASFKRQLLEQVRSVPGVENAASTTNTPLGGNSWEHNVRLGTLEGASKFTYASPSYFATMGIPLLTGRNFTEDDTNASPLVLIVNQAFVRKYLGNTPPIGQVVHVMPEPRYPERTYQIVGTIPDTKYNSLRDETPPMAFVPAAQVPETAEGPGVAMMIASNNPASAVDSVRRVVAAKYPTMIVQFFDFQQGIRDNLVRDRMMAMLSGFFGLLAAVLVVVGLYGVLSFFIAQRRNEIGIRVALGARRIQVISLVLRDTVAMLLAGIVVGIALALLAGRAAGAMLFGLKPWDLATLASAFVLLSAIALIASFVPALRASRLDPMVALRSE
jgi:predicted permease